MVDKKIRYGLLIIAIGYLVSAILFSLDMLGLFMTSPRSIGHWSTAILSYFLGGLALYFFFIMPKMASDRKCKQLGIIGMVSTPILAVVLVFTCFIVPQTLRVALWFFIIMMVLAVLQFVFSIAFLIWMMRRIQNEKFNYLPVLSNVLLSSFVQIAIICAYIFAIIRQVYTLNIETTDIDEAIKALTPTYLITMFIQFLIVLVVIVLVFFISYITYIAGRENKILGAKGTFKVTIRLIEQYEVVFWSGNLFYIGMFLFASISTIFFGGSYVPLVILYATLILIRIPMFFWRRKIMKGNIEEHEKFRRLHTILVYGGILLIISTILSFLFGEASLSKVSTAASAFMTYAIFVPWGIYRFVVGIYGLTKIKKNGDPYIMLKAFLDLAVAITTFNSALFYVASVLRGNAPIGPDMDPISVIFLAVAVFFVILEIIYSLFISITLIVLGIRGLKNKREVVYEVYQKTHYKNGNMKGEGWLGISDLSKTNGKN